MESRSHVSHNEGLDSVVPLLALTSLAPPLLCRCGPSTRLFWPPPRSMCTSGSSGPDLSLESAAARVCREAGERVMANMLVRDMDLALGANHMADGRRLEVVVDGLSLFHGAQQCIDTTLVSALRADGTPRPGKEALPWMTRGHGKRSRTATAECLWSDEQSKRDCLCPAKEKSSTTCEELQLRNSPEIPAAHATVTVLLVHTGQDAEDLGLRQQEEPR